jgi:hypothetical protein
VFNLYGCDSFGYQGNGYYGSQFQWADADPNDPQFIVVINGNQYIGNGQGTSGYYYFTSFWPGINTVAVYVGDGNGNPVGPATTLPCIVPQNYSFNATAIQIGGVYQPTLTVTTPAVPLSNPTNLTVNPVTNTMGLSVTLEATAPSNAQSLAWRYSTDNTNWTTCTTSVSGLTLATTYYFECQAVGDGTNYTNSGWASVSYTTPTGSNPTSTGNQYYMGISIIQNSPNTNLVFPLGQTGLTPTVTLSKNGSAYAAPYGTVSEVGNGLYQVAGNATDTNTLGVLALHATAGSNSVDVLYEIVQGVWNATMGSYPSSSAGGYLSNIKSQVSLIPASLLPTQQSGGQTASQANITIIQGNDYLNSLGNALDFTSENWISLVGATVTMTVLQMQSPEPEVFQIQGTVVTAGADNTAQAIMFEPTHSETALAPVGNLNFDIEATTTEGYISTLVRGQINVLENYALTLANEPTS